MTQKSQAYLKSLVRKVKWTTQEKNLPMSQGFAINKVINLYHIPAIRWGWEGSTIGVETKRQYILWRDKGGELEFLGLVNKEVPTSSGNLLHG